MEFGVCKSDLGVCNLINGLRLIKMSEYLVPTQGREPIYTSVNSQKGKWGGPMFNE